MGERKAVTKHLAESYRAGDRVSKGGFWMSWSS